MTVVHVPAAIRSLETLSADASVVSVRGVHAGRSVFAGAARAGWRSYVTGCTLPTWWTVASEPISAILTRASVPTGPWLAVTAPKGAGFALPTSSADAGEVRHAVDAGAVVATGRVHAFVHVWKEEVNFVRSYLKLFFKNFIQALFRGWPNSFLFTNL